MSIFKDTFKKGVQDQLATRQKAIAERTPAAIQYYNARNAWVRLSSSVDVGKDKGALAKKYILQGGTLYQNSLRAGVGVGDEAYSLNSPGGNTNRLGIRPMPGITGMDIQSKGSYGSLRSVTINFIAWDLRQLEDLELLYMRPGYTALIEWGWAPYLNNDGSLASANTIQFYDIIDKTPSQNQIYMDLFKKSSETGNYDAMYGKIQNYSWKARSDGGYDCTTTIISIGEVIDSLKVNYSPFDIPNVEKTGIIAKRIKSLPSVQNKISGSYSQNIVAGLASELYAIADERASDNQIYKIVDKFSDGSSATYTFYKVPIKIANAKATKTSITKSGNQIFVTLESFVAIMNKYVLMGAKNAAGKTEPYVQLSVNASTITSNGSPLLCLGDYIQISTNPSVCLIANNAWLDPAKNLGITNAESNDTLKKFISAALGQKKGYFYNDDFANLQYGVIGNIFINLDYIYSLVTDDNVASQDKKEKNDISLYTFIKSLMSGINAAIGNVANFDVHVDPTDGNIARIIDVNYVDIATREEAYNKAFTFEMQSTGPVSGSIMRNYSFESSIFPEQSAIVAIGAQVEGGALGSDTNTLVDFYQNLVDRILPKKSSPEVIEGESENDTTAESAAQTLQTNLETLVSFVNELDSTTALWIIPISDGSYDISKASSYSNALKDIINYFKSISKSNTKNRGIIPTKLSFELDGIGGMVIGNMFRIPDEILPRGYKGGGAGPAKIGFLVLKLGHSIQNNDWTTNVDSQFVILDEPRGSTITTSTRTEITRAASSGNLNPAIRAASQTTKTICGQVRKNGQVDDLLKEISPTLYKRHYSFINQSDNRRIRLQPEAMKNLEAMLSAAYNQGIYIKVNSAYRTYEDQVRVKADSARTGIPAATPGRSNHGFGLALDLANSGGGRINPVTTPKEWAWIQANKTKYGFQNLDNDKESHHYNFTPPGIIC
jgi:LAS superfamily LD-carboxypeptidase LdcB